MKSILPACVLRRTLGLVAGLAILHLWTGEAAAQTVQLPSFHYFAVDTTVLVPDGGDAFLGGASSSSFGRSERGIPGFSGPPFVNTAIGTTTGASNVSVSAQIHDFGAMEDALIGPPSFQTDVSAWHLSASQQAAIAVPNPALQSVAALKAEQAAENVAADEQAAAALARGRQWVAQHKLGVAKIYFQNAAKQASPAGEVRQQALAALTAIEQSQAAGKVAGQ
ncbi:MAG TPA: hypothetical protein VFE46_04560 [Pirellulales bacterium]|jgi:hypothetical protein|nr:hypothetical protein [Pirellulales bacterium]